MWGQDEIFECPPGGMSVAQLAGHLAVDPNEVVLKLFMKGLAAKVNQVCPLRPALEA